MFGSFADKDTTMGSIDYIETAFLHLSFALKLQNYLDNHPINKDEFDIDLTYCTPNSIVVLNSNEFNTDDDLKLVLENNLTMCYGCAAITLWEAVEEKGIYTPARLPEPLSTEEEEISGLIYMIRCCFAHSPALPKWVIKNDKYRTTYKTGNKTIDLSNLNGNSFSYDSIGGFETLYFLKNEAKSRKMI